MATIIWNTEVNAPGCIGEIVHEDGRTRLIQVDYDYPGVARTFGWNMAQVQLVQEEDEGPEVVYADCDEVYCDHSGTDGSVDCPNCNMVSGDFINAATDWLAENNGAKAEDPGYFEERV